MFGLTCAERGRKTWLVGIVIGGALAIALLLGHVGVALADEVGPVTLTPPEMCRFMQENIPDFTCEEQWDGPDGSADLPRTTEGVGVPPYPPEDVIVGMEIAIY